MPIDNLPNAMMLPSRDQIVSDYLRDYSLRNPSAQTVDNTMPAVDAAVIADTLVPVYADVKALGEYAANQNRSGAALDAEATRLGTERLPATTASGFVLLANCSAGGGTIFAGDEIRALNNGGYRYQCLATGFYQNGSEVPVGGGNGTDVGPATNQAAGTILTWTSPRPGIAPTAAVVAQADGSGLSNGRNIESDADLDKRLVALRANPPASGNDAEFQDQTLDTPGLFPQAAFTYMAINGPGSIGVAATLRPATPGASRIPNSTQLAQINAWLVGQFPYDDSISVCSLIASPVSIVLAVTWAQQAAGWVDLTPWPPAGGTPVTVSASPAPTPTTFRLAGSPGVQPQIGQSLAFYDAASQVFRRKTIASFSGTGPWDILVYTINGVSDVGYTPAVGQAAGPWSDSLNALIAPIVAYFDGLGPGEQLSSLPDPAFRQRRSPRSPTQWPSVLTSRILGPIYALTTIADVSLTSPSVPYVTPVGTPGVSSYLLTLGNIAAFPS